MLQWKLYRDGKSRGKSATFFVSCVQSNRSMQPFDYDHWWCMRIENWHQCDIWHIKGFWFWWKILEKPQKMCQLFPWIRKTSNSNRINSTAKPFENHLDFNVKFSQFTRKTQIAIRPCNCDQSKAMEIIRIDMQVDKSIFRIVGFLDEQNLHVWLAKRRLRSSL